jgi:predicted phosphoribosyltransferase
MTSAGHIVFENRFDAGRQLAERLLRYRDTQVIVLAIPNGGVPIGLQVALAIGAQLDLIIARKLPIPLRPEGGFGAVTADGTVILNQNVLRNFPLSEQQINFEVSKVRNDIQKRSLYYRSNRPLSVTSGKTAIVVDDGLASGYTMMAAVESIRRWKPKEVIAAVPAASAVAVREVERVADRVITVVTAYVPKFYVSDYYQYWHVLTDAEGLRCYQEWKIRRNGGKLKPY